MTFHIAGWAISLERDAAGRDYWRARRGPWQRGAHTPAGLAAQCAATPLHTTPTVTPGWTASDLPPILALIEELEDAA